MIDSLNLIIKLKYLNFNHLKKLGIKIQYVYDYYIRFKYKNLEFKYDSIHKYLLIIAYPHKVLKKKNILLKDKEIYKNKVHRIIKEILANQNIKIKVNRIDYCVDVYVGEKIDEYCQLLNKHLERYQYMKQHKNYKTSKYLTNKRGQRHLNIYSRYEKTKDIEDLGILRLEVQNHAPKIKREYRVNDIPKIIDYYWSKEAMELYFFDFLEPYLYEGDYYKRDVCKKIIDASNIKKLVKKRLNNFLLMESRYGIDGMIKKKKYCYDTVRKYIKILNELKINPITIPNELKDDHLFNLLKLAKTTSKEKYFI